MIDLHCHLLPNIDDGPETIDISLKMAQSAVADGITTVACTPHILPGVYPNQGPDIRQAVKSLQSALDDANIALRLVTGADVHIAPDLVDGLRSGRLLSLADSRYVLVEPPHHVAPARMGDLFFNLVVAGYTPVLTHPERLAWIDSHYGDLQRLVRAGVWMQVTAGSLEGSFGRGAQKWAHRMLDEGLVHILATDAHDLKQRAPILSRGRELAATRVGEIEAGHLVLTRPLGILNNAIPGTLPMPSTV